MRRPSEKPTTALAGLRVQSTGLGWKAQTGDNQKGHVRKEWRVEEAFPWLRFRGWMLKPTAVGPAGGKTVQKEALSSVLLCPLLFSRKNHAHTLRRCSYSSTH